MKKLLASLLAVVLCLSLTACGVEERIAQLDRNVYEVIEITVDNWQDYFEIVEVTVWETDEAGEVVDCYGVITSLCLKEEFADKTLSEKTELEFQYRALRHICEFTADLEKQEITIGAPDSQWDEEISRKASYVAPDKRNASDQAIYDYTSAYPVITHLLFSATGYATYRLENVVFTDIKGALIFEK